MLPIDWVVGSLGCALFRPSQPRSENTSNRAWTSFHPNFGPKFGWKDVQARLLVFSDRGWLGRNSAQPSEPTTQSIGSIGFGARLTEGQRFVVRGDYARVIDAGGTA